MNPQILADLNVAFRRPLPKDLKILLTSPRHPDLTAATQGETLGLPDATAKQRLFHFHKDNLVRPDELKTRTRPPTVEWSLAPSPFEAVLKAKANEVICHSFVSKALFIPEVN